MKSTERKNDRKKDRKKERQGEREKGRNTAKRGKDGNNQIDLQWLDSEKS